MGVLKFSIGALQTGILAKLVQLAKHPLDPLRTRDGVDLSFLIVGEVWKPKVIERVMEGKIMKWDESHWEAHLSLHYEEKGSTSWERDGARAPLLPSWQQTPPSDRWWYVEPSSWGHSWSAGACNAYGFPHLRQRRRQCYRCERQISWLRRMVCK